jgi:hypothetical protein
VRAPSRLTESRSLCAMHIERTQLFAEAHLSSGHKWPTASLRTSKCLLHREMSKSSHQRQPWHRS